MLLETHIIDHFLSAEECQQLISLGKQYPKKTTAIQENMVRTWKRVSDIVADPDTELQNRLQEVHQKVGREIADRYNSPHCVPRDVGYFYEYGMGDYYKPHVDSQTVTVQQEIAIAVRKSSSSDISSVLYLNDNFVGGELDFLFANKSVKPKAGRLILFYGGWQNIHAVRPIQVGKRYCIVNWYKTSPELVPQIEQVPSPYGEYFAQIEEQFKAQEQKRVPNTYQK